MGDAIEFDAVVIGAGVIGLAVANEICDIFDNVIVNDEDQTIKKNRLELLQMVCKTFDTYINFSNIESIS